MRSNPSNPQDMNTAARWLNWRTWLPSRGNVVFVLFVAAALLFYVHTVGAVPSAAPAAASTSIIPYQGRLADSGGNPLNGSYAMTFRLYNLASGGNALWAEARSGGNSVVVSNGLFNVLLGSLTSLPASIFSTNSSLWLGISVGADIEMAPRVQMGSAPYSAFALNIADNSVSSVKLQTGAVTRGKLGSDVGLVQIQSGSFNGHGGTPTCTMDTSTPGQQDYCINHVDFPQSFATPPTISVAISKLDISNTANTRVNVYAQNVTATGFDMVFNKWDTTVIFEITASWVAYAPR